MPDVSAAYEDFENSQIRKVIAERLTYSKQNIPHYYVTIQVQVDSLLALRAKLNKHSSSKISVNDMVIKAASLAATNSASEEHVVFNFCFLLLLYIAPCPNENTIPL